MKAGTGTWTDTGPDAAHFLSDGSAGTSVSKLVDVIPGATYEVKSDRQRIGSVTNPFVRMGISRTGTELFSTQVSNTTKQTVTNTITPTNTPVFLSLGYGPTGCEIDVSAISLRQTVSSIAIAAYGDSLTDGTGATNVATDSYPVVAATKFSTARSVFKRAFGGQTSDQIAGRQGSKAVTVTVSGDQIPASGGVSVTAKNINVLTNAGAFTGSQIGYLAGIRGTMTTDASGNWTFTREIAGSAVPCPAGSVFTIESGVNVRSLTQWLWAGRNDIGTAVDTLANIAGMIAYSGHSRYLVGSILPSTGDGDLTTALSIERVSKNNALAAKYGTKYVNVLAALQAAHDGSANDLSDIANGWVPRSLRSDSVHLNTAGYAIVAQAFYDAHIANGYP